MAESWQNLEDVAGLQREGEGAVLSLTGVDSPHI